MSQGPADMTGNAIHVMRIAMAEIEDIQAKTL
jgi:hypothetical protein